jgi:hypothetical protein
MPFSVGQLVPEGTPKQGVRARNPSTGLLATHVPSTSTRAPICPPAHLDEINQANYDPDMSDYCSDCDRCTDAGMDDESKA